MGQDGGTKTVSRLLDSTLESVDAAEELALGLARQVGFREEDLERIGMAVRESMVNAVVHGNRYNPQKRIEFSVSTDAGQFTIRIADQGEGFDLNGLADPLAHENLLRSSGRGIFLIRAFMDEFQVRRLDPLGTEVTLVKNIHSCKQG